MAYNETTKTQGTFDSIVETSQGIKHGSLKDLKKIVVMEKANQQLAKEKSVKK